MKKFWKRFALILSAFLLLTIISAIVLVSAFEGKIGQRIVSEVNKQLKSELQIKKFDLTVLSTFPNVSANLRDVVLKDTREDTLLKAKNLSFRFGLFSLMGSNVKVKSVVVQQGALNIYIDRKGRANYNIFKETEKTEEPTSSNEEMAISLELAKLKNIQITYTDRSSKQAMKAEVEDAVFSGKFSSEKFSLISKANLKSQYYAFEKGRFLVNKFLDYDAKILVDLKEGIYQLDKFDIGIEDNLFIMDGTIEQWETGTYFDLYATCDNGNLESVVQLLPQQYMEDLWGLKSSGKFFFTTIIKGQLNKKQNPEMQIEFGLDDGRITSPRIDGAFKDVSFTAEYKNGKYRTNESSTFQIKELTGYFNRDRVELDLLIKNFEDPNIKFSLDGTLPLEEVYGLLKNPKITKGGGEVEIKNLSLNGRYKDMVSNSRIARVKTGGVLVFDDASLTINGEKMIIDRGNLELKNNNLLIEDLKLEGNDTELVLNGSAFNVIPVLFADSINSKRAELEFQAKLDAKSLDIDRLLGLSADVSTETRKGIEEIDSIKTERIQQRARITNFLNGTFDANIESFNFNKIQGEEFVGKLEFNNNELDIKGQTKAMGGFFKLDGMVFFEDRPRLNAKLDCQKIDVTTFFEQSENFGQDVLTYKNLKGQLDAKIAIYAYWDEEGHFLQDKLRIISGVGIKNGELVGFEMLESFSKIIKIEDLKRIKFVNMQNFLEYRKQKLFMPVMFIQSNALNLTISGEHSYDNQISYNMKVNAGQVVLNRLKKHDPSFKPLKARQSGWFNLYYNINGTLDEYEIKSAKRQVKNDFRLSELRKQEIHEDLEREFGFVEFVREPASWQDIPEFDHGDEEEIYIDWEEN